jgi:hypothetical protein
MNAAQAARIYNAGVFAGPVPYIVGERMADVECLYNKGYIAYWDALDKDTEILPHTFSFVHRLLKGDPKLAADLAAYRAAVAHK